MTAMSADGRNPGEASLGMTGRSQRTSRAPAQSIDPVLCAQHESWNRGERLSVESLVARYPDISFDDAAVLDLIYSEILLRESAGETPTLDEYEQRFPHLREPLVLQFDVHRGMTELERDPARKAPAPGMASLSHPAARSGENYELLAEIGRGGAGVVYQARDPVLDRVVALKMLISGSYAGRAERLRFRREAALAAQLQHPHIVQVYDFGERDGCSYIAFEFMDGGSLAERLNGTPQEPREAAGFIASLARAVQFAHDRGVVHRDLKPANILLQSAGSACATAAQSAASRLGAVAKITDFGLAKCQSYDGASTHNGTLIGTPGYMAPEQAAGHVRAIGPRSDIYALGAILYELLTGRAPFSGVALVDVLEQVQFQEPVSPRSLQPRLPRDLETICLKCLHKDPARRYASAGELAEDLQRFLEARPIQARPVGPLHRLWRWCRRKPAVASLAAALGLLCFVGVSAVLVLWRRAEHQRRQAEFAQARSERSFQKAHAFTRDLRRTLRGAALSKAPEFDSLRRSLTEAIAMYHQAVTHERGDDVALLRELAELWQELAEERAISARIPEAFEAYYKSLALRVGLASQPEMARDAWRAIADTYDAMARLCDHSGQHRFEAAGYHERARQIRDAALHQARFADEPVPRPDATPNRTGDGTTTNSIGMALRLIRAGQFAMGSPPDEVARSSDEQSATGQYTVQISQDFYMGVYEVTAAQYAAVLDESPCFFQGQRGGGPDYPVENVSWHDAVRFCNRLSDRTAERRAGRSYRLPTEAEWEYACRAGSTTAFSFGNTLGSRQANFDGLFPLPHGARGPFRARTAPFGSYPANAWGLHDMHGNVAEWVQDWYHAAYPAGPARDPRGPSSGLAPVVRGGHWLGTARFCRSAYRVDYDANDRCSYIGFRVVMQVAGADRNHATP